MEENDEETIVAVLVAVGLITLAAGTPASADAPVVDQYTDVDCGNAEAHVRPSV